jgi:hypothetical protein
VDGVLELQNKAPVAVHTLYSISVLNGAIIRVIVPGNLYVK